MKKLLSSIFALTISFSFVFCLITNVNAATRPNDGYVDHVPLSFYYYGHVWCTPSYNQKGQHAARAYLRFYNYDTAGNRINDTGRLYTEYENGPTDSRVIRKDYTYTDTIYFTENKAQFFYGFTWVPTGGVWPVSLD